MSNERFEERLSAIRLENLSDPIYAYVDLRFFIGTLPHHIRDLVEPEIQQVDFALILLSRNQSWQRVRQERKKEFMKYVVLTISNKISALLQGQIEATALQRKAIDFYSSFMSWLDENKEKISDAVAAYMDVAESMKKTFSKLREHS